MVSIFLVALYLLQIIHGIEIQANVIYDIKPSFENGIIKEEHVINCGESRNYIDVNFTGDAAGHNAWFQWETQSDIKTIAISVAGSTNEWLYFLHDADDDAAEGLLTISSLVEICHECGVSKNKIDINLDNDAFSRGTYWIGADGNFNISVQCTLYDTLIIDDDEILIISLAITFIVLFSVICIGFAVFKNYQYSKRKKNEQALDKQTELKALEIALELAQTKNDKDGSNDNEKEEKIEIPEDEEEKYGLCEAALSSKNILYEDILNTINDTLDDEDLDIYQILAFRQNYDEKRVIKEGTSSIAFMFKFTKYQQALFTAAITSTLQTFGITVTLSSVVVSYFSVDDGHAADCEWQKEVWVEDGEYKVLAFLWAWIISLSVVIYASQIESNGLNKLLKIARKTSKDSDEYYQRIQKINKFLNVPILQYGVINNYYTLTAAILGSFFLIYESESGEDALDMILNAVALYFMIELDDMLVSKKDIRDLNDHKHKIVKTILMDKNEKNNDKTDVDIITKCFVMFGAFIRYTSAFIIIASTFIAPFVILTCW